MMKEKLTFWGIIAEGIRKFAGTIIGVLMVAVFLYFFPHLRSLFSDYRLPWVREETHLTQENSKPDSSPELSAISDEAFVGLCESGNAGEIEEAILNGANVDAKESNYGTTALMAAALKGKTETAKLLLRHGANVNAEDNNGWRALMWASAKGKTETAELLLRYGADVDAKDNEGNTALMYATREDNTEIARLLSEYGATE